MSRAETIVVISGGGGHMQRMLPLIAALVRRGATVHVLSRREVRAAVEGVGGLFLDLDVRYPLDAADGESVPIPSRLVTFAAVFAEPLIAEVAALGPSLLIYDSFTVVAPLIGRRLGIPYVGMRAGHAQVPARAVAEVRRDPRVRTSPACLAAVEVLRREHGMTDAHPFSYLEGLSPYLNLYAEPPAYLDDEDRRTFEPIAFVGSLAPELRDAASVERPLARGCARLRVYAAFGGIIWRYWAREALSALECLARVLAEMDAEVLVSVGHHPLDAAERRRLERPNLRVEGWVDQWGALKDADLFVTHHGLNSTHEAIYHQVAMLSYPFFADQPALARRCQEMGLAVPLAKAPRAPIEDGSVRRAIEHVQTHRAGFAARLAEARTWELEVIDGREAVLDRMLALAGSSAVSGPERT